MFKFILPSFFILTFALSILVSNTAQATLIETDITSDNYITYNGIDIAWASKVNTERYYITLDEVNLLLSPDVQAGWSFGTEQQLSMLTNLSGNDILALFTRMDGSYINAFEYWNTIYSAIENSDDLSNIEARDISSEWVWSIPLNDDFDSKTNEEKIQQINEITNTTGSFYDTFYFRVSSNQSNPVNPVPEPSTLLIFAMGLFGLTVKSRKKS